MTRQTTHWALGLSAWLFASSCVEDACTEIACDDLSVVSLPIGFVDGPYDLQVVANETTYTARCLQPAAPEAADNSPELECSASTFELSVPPGTSARELRVTITDVDTEMLLVESAVVALGFVGEETPNGPDCPPICFERNGALEVPSD